MSADRPEQAGQDDGAGKTAYEAWNAHLQFRTTVAWDTLRPESREAWEAAAQAAYADRHASCTAEIDRLRTLLHETTAERDDAREQAAAIAERKPRSERVAEIFTEVNGLREERDKLRALHGEAHVALSNMLAQRDQLEREARAARAEVKRCRQALEGIARDSDGYDPDTNEYAHHSMAIAALRGSDTPAVVTAGTDPLPRRVPGATLRDMEAQP